MFSGFTNDLLSFYADIRFNNNKAFMDAHRKEYYAKVRDPFYAFIDELAPTMLKIDEDMEVRPHKCLSRINRDTRYSKDKSPYRDHHWLAFRQAARGKDGAPFYWFEIRLDSVSWGLGVWGDNPALFDALRRRIAARPEEVMGVMAVRYGKRTCSRPQACPKRSKACIRRGTCILKSRASTRPGSLTETS